MKKLLFSLIIIGSTAYGAQAPLPKQPAHLSQESLEAFESLVNESKESKIPEITETHKELMALYQQAKDQTISLSNLSSQINALISKLNSANYKDKKFDSELYGYISLSGYANLLKDTLLPAIAAALNEYVANIPLPQIKLVPKTLPRKGVLSPAALESFESLVNQLKDSKTPEVMEIHKELNSLYQQTRDQKIFLSDLSNKLKTISDKLNSEPYKDKIVDTPLYEKITLAQFATLLNQNLLNDIEKTVSLFGISQQTINYFKDVINAIEGGKNAPVEVNSIKTQLMALQQRVHEKDISLQDLLDQLKSIQLAIKNPQYETIKFKNDKYGILTLTEFGEVILGSLIDHIEKKIGLFKFTPLPLSSAKPAAAPSAPKQPIKLIPTATPAKPTAPAAQPTAPQRPPSPPPVQASPHGLSNLGNSCFMNASLQNLSALDDLSTELLKRWNAGYYEQNSFADEYINFLHAVRSSSEKVLQPRAVCMRGWARMGFAPLSQQDNDEFINFLLGDLFNDKDPVRKLIEIRLQTFMNGNALLQDPGAKPIAPGLLLTVPANQPTLDANLQEFFAVEKGVPYGYPPKPSDKQEKIVNTSQYLIIHLKRNVAKLDPQTKYPMFDANDRMIMTKIVDPISFPTQNLDLNPYAIPGARLPFYRLKGIVIHTGTARGGHYYGYVRYGNQWYLVNDSQVSQVSQQEIERIARLGYADERLRPNTLPSETPTTLFYERM